MKIELEYRRGILFLRLDGVLNKQNYFILEDEIKTIVNKVGIKYLLINFEKLYEIDKDGILSIINSYNEYLRDRGKLMICGYNNNLNININDSNLLKYALPIKNEISAFDLINI